MPLTSFIRMAVLEDIDARPIREIPIINDEIINLMPGSRPNALVYTIPIHGAKVVVSEDEGCWKGITFLPEKTNSTFAWHSENLNLATWAKTPSITRAMLFVTSRVDDDGMAHFQIPNTKFIISARWDTEKRRFENGFVTDATNSRRQEWTRSGWFSSMDYGFFNYNANIRRMQNMICRVMTVSDGGLDPKIPA